MFGGNLVLSTRLMILNYPVILSHRRSTSVSLETCPLYSLDVQFSSSISLVTTFTTSSFTKPGKRSYRIKAHLQRRLVSIRVWKEKGNWQQKCFLTWREKYQAVRKMLIIVIPLSLPLRVFFWKVPSPFPWYWDGEAQYEGDVTPSLPIIHL